LLRKCQISPAVIPIRSVEAVEDAVEDAVVEAIE
jgi:hypothetical protein